jgi:hypothetical protein
MKCIYFYLKNAFSVYKIINMKDIFASKNKGHKKVPIESK